MLFSWELDDRGAVEVEGMEMEMELESGWVGGRGGGAKWTCLGRESEGNLGAMKGGEVERWRVSGIVATELLTTWLDFGGEVEL